MEVWNETYFICIQIASLYQPSINPSVLPSVVRPPFHPSIRPSISHLSIHHPAIHTTQHSSIHPPSACIFLSLSLFALINYTIAQTPTIYPTVRACTAMLLTARQSKNTLTGAQISILSDWLYCNKHYKTRIESRKKNLIVG